MANTDVWLDMTELMMLHPLGTSAPSGDTVIGYAFDFAGDAALITEDSDSKQRTFICIYRTTTGRHTEWIRTQVDVSNA